MCALAIWGALLFVAAGDWKWQRGWSCIAAYGGTFLFNLAFVGWFNPSVIAERGKKHKGTKPFERKIGLVFLPLVVAVPIVGGLDAVRFQWSVLPFSTFYGGVVLLFLGTLPIAWSMATNPHLETTVRIQVERNHQVITSGPYSWVRHPMYVGMILQYLGIPLMLGSLWSYVPSLLAIVVMIVRTHLEDQTLQQELSGYNEYTQHTRYRLLPGIW